MYQCGIAFGLSRRLYLGAHAQEKSSTLPNMKTMLLQLSDIHLENKSNPIEKKVKKLVDAIRNLEVGLECVVLIFSGDIAWSGLPEEYERAKALLQAIKSAIQNELGVNIVHVLTIPGNHDCSFKSGGQLRDIVIGTFSGGTGGMPDAEVVDACCSVQRSYMDFAEAVETPARNTNEKLYWEFDLSIGEYKLLFKCYNTAWVSTLHEKAAQMVYPLGIFTATNVDTGCDLIVSMYHHPTNWLLPNLGRAFREHVDRTSDIVFTGHEHISNAFLKLTFSGEINQYIEGGVLQERGKDQTSAFNVVFVNLATQRQRIVFCDWKVDHYEVEEASGGWVSYLRNKLLAKKDFAVSSEFAEYLSDAGASFVHPAKSILSLEDILVLPSCKGYKAGDKKHSERTYTVESKDLLKVLTSKEKLLIVGSEKTGKTTLAKVLFTHHFNSGKVPIRLHGSEINSVELQQLEKLIERQLRRQYNDPPIEKFQQLSKTDVVIIIDDFDAAKLNLKGKRQLLDEACKRYNHIVLLSNGLIRFEELAEGSKDTSVVNSFSQFDISEFGHLLRDKLIERWFNIGIEFQGDPEEINQKIRAAENRINILLGNSYLPSVPIFILTFLQAISNAETSNSAAGSYGYLYEVLITKALSTRPSKIKLDTKYTYLSEFAHRLHSANVRELSPFESKIFHDQYCKLYKINPSQSTMIEELLDSDIIVHVDDCYQFKYAYTYYYFVARYYRDNLHEKHVQDKIRELSAGTLKEEQSNILLFLTHLSKDPFIINSILARSRTVFASSLPLKFEEDVAFLNSLYAQVPKTVLLEKDAKTSKEEYLKKVDALEEPKTKRAQSSSNYQSDEDQDIDAASEFMTALKLLQILGQIVKNFPGSLKGATKLEVVDECYKIGMRCLSAIFSSIEGNAPQLIEMTVARVNKLHPRTTDEEELRKEIKSFLFTMTEGAAFGIIKQISQSVGAADLAETYNEVQEHNGTNAVSLIDMSIKLDHFVFPTREVPKLYERMKDSVFCGKMLRSLVVHHFYLFPTKTNVKQAICKQLDIAYQSVQALEQSNKNERKFSRLRKG